MVAKRRAIFNSIRHTTDITILTETKFKQNNLAIYKREWGSGMLTSCTPEVTAQAGVAILFRKGLAVNTLADGKDKDGRVVWALVEINSKKLLIIGIYAPSKGDDPKFFKDIVFPILSKAEYDHVIIAGDWNLGMDENLDYWGYNTTDSVRPKSRSEVHKNIEHYELLDVYRELYPSGSDKTWKLWNKRQSKNDKEARLDYFIVDSGLASYVQLIGVAAPFTSDFDHRPVIMNIDFNKVKRGPGYWKFNNSMLNEADFLRKVREQIAWTLSEYQDTATPETPPLSVHEILCLTPAQQSDIQLTINPHQFLEFLLFSIKGVARKHGKEKKANLLTRKERAEEQLRKESKVHDALLVRIRSEPLNGATEEAFFNSKNKISELQKELFDIDTHMNEGAYIRCGAKWKCESEAPSRVFFQCEKWRGQQRYMGILEVDGDEPGTTKQVTNQPEIESEIRTFYSNLYKERPTSNSDTDLRGFMGDIGYNKFQNSAKKNTSGTFFDKMSEEISSNEVLHAIKHGKHGVAPGISGFSREFYQKFGDDLIGFIMKYIQFSEQTGILSDNQRIGVITLLPKGTKDKKSLKNWRPITLLSTLYKIISGVIGNRFKQFLPKIIALGQEGFVDGRYMGEVTRLLYDTIYDAYSTKGKTGIIMSIDFEKAFDSVSFSFMEKVIETAGFPKIMQTWVKILLKGFKSHINNAGNLLKLIELGRGARQGDPIASILFVLSIEILLIAIRNNQKIEPYVLERPVIGQAIKTKVGAYADDVTIIMPRSEKSIKEVVSTLDKFETLAGLRVNKDKTQMLRIGKGATSDKILCEDLGLKWVTRLKVLGVNLSAAPHEMMENLDEKISEIESLLNNFTYRNITVYGRIRVVKAIALSKVTHLIQIIPNPPPTQILKLQRIINKFIWTGPGQKKVVIKKEAAELPPSRGGLAIPNIEHFWNGLKLAWLNRLFTSHDDTTWKKLAMYKLSTALRITNLNTTKLLEQGPDAIRKAATQISNPFWKAVLLQVPHLERTFYTCKSKDLIGERIVWDNLDFLHEGLPFSRRANSSELTSTFNCIRDFISKETNVLMEPHEAALSLKVRNLEVWNRVVSSVTQYLTENNITWYSIGSPETGPHHWGWSRLALENSKSKKFYELLMTRPPGEPRNPNEQKWRDSGLTTFNSDRFNKIYRNLSRLKCNLRVKYEELRIIWGRQELNKYKSVYANQGPTNNTQCSYCAQDTETELHLYTECVHGKYFMEEARKWFLTTFGVAPSLVLNGPRLFGLENEPPDDLFNIFYRSARYCIYSGRKRSTTPRIQVFIALVREELKLKYAGTRILKHCDKPNESKAINWLNVQMGWTLRVTSQVPNHLNSQT